MRSAIGLIVANLFFIGAGVGVLQLFGIVDRNPRRVVPALGLALLAGIAAVLLVSTALLTIGISLGLILNMLICALFVAGGAFATRHGRESSEPAFTPREGDDGSVFWPLRGWQVNVAKVAIGLAVAGLLAFAVVAIRRYGVPSAQAWDEFAMWSKKAIALFHHGGLERDFFAGPAYTNMHQDYPVLLSAMEAFIFHFMGGVDTATMHVQFFVLLAAFGSAAAYLCVRPGANLLFVPVLLAVMVMPGVHSLLVSGYADLPVAFFVAIGAITMGLWLEDGRRPMLMAAALLLAGAASIKTEGLLAAFFVFTGAGAAILLRRSWPDLKALAIAGAAFVTMILPWQIWVKLHPEIQSFFNFSDGLNPRYLWENRENGKQGALQMQNFLVTDQYLMLFPIGVAIMVACLFARRTRPLGLFYLVAAFGTFAGLTWIFWVEPVISLDRVILMILFTAIAAALQLSGAASYVERRSEGD